MKMHIKKLLLIALAVNPLYCGAMSIQFHAGIAPIIWKDKGEVDLLSCNVSALNPVLQLNSRLPKFNALFHAPWIVGGILGYALSENIELYLEANYLQANGKTGANGFAFAIPNLVPAQSLNLTITKYRLFDAYLGVRYYWDRWCDRLAPFLGIKVGVVSHKNTRGSFSLNGVPLTLLPAAGINCDGATAAVANNNFFRHATSFGGGINAGLDYCLCGNILLVFTAEFVASCGPKTYTTSMFSVPTAPPLLATNLVIGSIGTEFRFPITAGIKYIF